MRTLFKVFVIAALGLAAVNTALAHTEKSVPREQTAIEKAIKAADRYAWSEALKQAKQAELPPYLRRPHRRPGYILPNPVISTIQRNRWRRVGWLRTSPVETRSATLCLHRRPVR